jgi:malate dehydrogenase (oxaloacetate-decarboxylating)
MTYNKISHMKQTKGEVHNMSVNEQAIALHKLNGGKLEIASKVGISNKDDLSLAYTPGVAAVCSAIEKDKEKVYDLTIKKNSVAIVTDGSAVLGLGNIGPEAALPVMEGKAILFKEFANIDAYPICLDTQDTQEIIKTVRLIAPGFGGINLEDISAPRCFEIEKELQDLGIPVFHDDQHGTSLTLLAALINSCKLSGKKMGDLKVVINGAGAAGTSIVEVLQSQDHDKAICEAVKQIVICDSKGVIHRGRPDIKDNPAKAYLAEITNPDQVSGELADAMVGADVFVGVSVANAVSQDMVRSMNDKPFVFAMSNPIPEIMPEDAKAAGAFVIGTGRSDFDNQVNNVLIFPGIFRGAMNARSKVINMTMKLAAAYALAGAVGTPTVDRVLPAVFTKTVANSVAKAVAHAAKTGELSTKVTA